MGLSAALFTGLSGLDVNQTQLNVAGNNIANVNTVAFKSSRAVFTPQFYVTSQSGSPPSANFGGSNPSQTGLGATVATIEKNLTQGSIQPTGIPTDLAINGQGFFVVQNASAGQEYTRDGSFTLNGNHQLVSSAGGFVQGYAADNNGKIIPGQLKDLTIPLGSATISKATSNVKLAGNLAADGVVATGSSVQDSQDLTITGGGGTPVAATPLTQLVSTASGNAAFTSGQVLTLKAQRSGSDITPPQTFTVSGTSTLGDLQTFFNNALGIDTSAAGAGTKLVNGAANSVKLQIVGNNGTGNALTVTSGGFSDASGNVPLSFTNDAANNPTGESAPSAITVYDSLGAPVTINVQTVLQSKSDSGSVWKFYATSGGNQDSANPNSTLVGTGTLTFNGTGQLINSSGSDLVVHRNNSGANPVLPVHLDFSGASSLAQDAAHVGSQLEATSQDGIQLGTLVGYSIGGDGTITGNFDNGQTRALGQVAIATFNNPQGLQDNGGNQYSASSNSGVPIITAPNRLGGGSIQAGALEQSNVDLAKEFTNLIVSSTGFSAADKVITTSNQLLTDLLNSQR